MVVLRIHRDGGYFEELVQMTTSGHGVGDLFSGSPFSKKKQQQQQQPSFIDGNRGYKI